MMRSFRENFTYISRLRAIAHLIIQYNKCGKFFVNEIIIINVVGNSFNKFNKGNLTNYVIV